MEILLTSVAEAWRKKHTSKDTTRELTDSRNNHISNHNESTNNSDNINNNTEPPSAANNRNHDAHRRRHDRSIRIGAWPLGTSTGLSTENIERMEPRAIVRTGSSISREEREVETCHRKHLANSSGSVPYSQEVQRLQWFRLLVVLLALLICVVIVFVLAGGALGGSEVVYFWNRVLRCLLTIGFYMTVYIGFFIVLTEYHSEIGAFLDRYLYFRRQYQPLCLRVFAYLYAGCVIMRLGLRLTEDYNFEVWVL